MNKGLALKWEYHIEEMEMPAQWRLEEKWEDLRIKHLEKLNALGKEGWEYMMSIGPLFYFKRTSVLGINNDPG